MLGLYKNGSVYNLDFIVGGARLTATTTSISLNIWTHVAVVRSSGVLMLFTGGVKDASTLSYSSTINRTGTVTYIGESIDGFYFLGGVDEFRVSNGIARWAAGFTPPTSEYSMDTDTRPTYVKGTLYFDTAKNKLFVGGASNWEMISSA
jgi:hypothetical protein